MSGFSRPTQPTIKFTKPVKMAWPDFSESLEKAANLCKIELTPDMYENLYQQVYHIHRTAFRKACWHYVYKQKEKFPSNFLADLRAKTYEFSGDFSDIMPTGISVKVTAEKLRLDAELRQKAKAMLPPPRGRPKSAKELAEGMGIPKNLPSSAELQSKADDMRRKLLERMK